MHAFRLRRRVRRTWAAGSIAFAALALWIIPFGWVANAAAPQLRAKLPILMYHKIVKLPEPSLLRTSPEAFAQQMAFLAAHGYHTISLEQWLAFVQHGGRLPRNPIVITFDDGYEDNIQNALPVLEQHRFTATFFIIAGKAGGTIRWPTENGKPLARLMDWEAVGRLAKAGMEIGSHTMTHPDLAQLSEVRQLAQIKTSREVIGRQIGRPVTVFSYPFGLYDADSVKAVKTAGYRAAVTTNQGFNYPTTNLFELRRIRVRGGESLEAFAQSLQRGYSGERP